MSDEHILSLSDLPNLNPFPVLKCDARGRILFMNLAARTLLASLGVSESDAKRILPPDYTSRVCAILERKAGIMGLLHPFEDRSLVFTLSPDEARAECMVLVEDVTDQRHAHDRIRAYARKLEEANRRIRDAQAATVQSEKMASLGNLVAGVAHEINTPVGSVNANADLTVRALKKLKTLLQDLPITEKKKEVLKTIQILEDVGEVNRTACERIVKIVRSLRNFARLDEAERKTVDIHEGLESTLLLVHHELKRRIEVIRDYGDLPPVECFPSQVNQVYMNLLVNAAHAIPEKGTIRITTRQEDRDVTVAFADDGSGIDEAVLSRIFDPGFTTKGVGVGSGLGLAICYQIMSDHGGRIEVTPNQPRGTVFTIALPIQKARAESLPSPGAHENSKQLT